MDFGKAIRFPFDDDDWLKKLGIALVVGFIPIVQFAQLGWRVKLIQNVKNGDELPLPDISDDFGAYWTKGLLAAIGWFIHWIPSTIFIAATVVIGSLATGSDSGGVVAIGFVVLACCGCLGFILLIVSQATHAGAIIRFAETESLSTFLEFGTNFKLVRNNLSQFLTAWLYISLVIAILVAVIWTVIAAILFGVVFTYVSGHILGQLAQKLEEGGAPAASPAPAAPAV